MLAVAKKPRGTKAPKYKDLVYGKPLPSLTMTEDEFIEWAEEETHAEWVQGSVVLMSPVNFKHDQLTVFFIRYLGLIAEVDEAGTVCNSEFYVRFADQQVRRLPDTKFGIQPRTAIIHDKVIEGAPDLIIEVVSKDSVVRDYRDKYNDYLKAGVREYWIVDPLREAVEVNALKGKKYVKVPMDEQGVLRSLVLPKFGVKPPWLWNHPLPSVLKIAREMGLKFE